MKTPTPPRVPTPDIIKRLIVRQRGAIQLDILDRAVEPWLELGMLELGRICQALDAGEGDGAAAIIKRVCQIQRHLISQLQLLDTLDAHATAPRKDEHECGESTVLRETVRIARDHLWPSFERFLSMRSITLWAIYEDESRYPMELRVAEGLTTYDRLFQRWREGWRATRRSIGARFVPGTSLFETTESWPPFFPALWNARAQ